MRVEGRVRTFDVRKPLTILGGIRLWERIGLAVDSIPHLKMAPTDPA